MTEAPKQESDFMTDFDVRYRSDTHVSSRAENGPPPDRGVHGR